VRDQHDVAGLDRGQHLDRPVGRAVDVLVGETRPGRPVGDDVVVDLLELGLALADLVVLVRWVGAPVAARGQHLDGDETVRRELVRRREVANLTGARTGAA
jgi:hypothetical protein